MTKHFIASTGVFIKGTKPISRGRRIQIKTRKWMKSKCQQNYFPKMNKMFMREARVFLNLLNFRMYRSVMILSQWVQTHLHQEMIIEKIKIKVTEVQMKK